MYAASENYIKNIISDNRTFAIRLTFGSSTVLTGTTIQNITLDEVINSTDALTMGCACSNKVTINLINPPTDIAYEGANFTAEVGLLISDRPIEYEWIPLGKFYGADAETSNDFKNLKLTAYDGFSKMTDIYNATVESETTLQAVYNDLKTQLYEKCGITLKERVLPKYSISNFPYLENITYTQAIGYVAGCLGGMARFDRSDELEIVWYEDFGEEISRSMQYMNGFTRTTEKTLNITSLSTGTKDVPIVRGSGSNGTEISFENPYITDAMADDIYNKVNNFEYTPCQLKWRGNPAIQVGDIVTAIDKDGAPHKVLVMSRSLKVSGGCTDTIDCKGKSATKSAFSNSYESVGQKIERVYSNLEKAILDATNAITGNSGGYVELRDTNGDGKPDAIYILDNEDIELAEKVWCWNKSGLGYAYKAGGGAYQGPFATAITADGKINADFITTGMLSSERIRIGDEAFGDFIDIKDGVIRFGEADNPMSLKLGNVAVAGKKEYQLAFFSGDKRIGFFSSNSFEIENLTDGLIRFQNLEIMPRASGNITFNIRK